MVKIKIAFVIDLISEHPGGTEKQLLLLLKYLDRERFEPYLILLRNDRPVPPDLAGIQVYVTNFLSFVSIKSYYNLYILSRFLKREKIRILQTYFRDGNIVGIMGAWLAGVHTIIASRRNQGFWHNRKEIIILRLLNRLVTCFIANSQAIKIYTHQVEHVPLDKITVIYNGYEEAASCPPVTKEEVLLTAMRTAAAEQRRVIVQVSNLREVKRIDVLIRAAALVRQQKADILFLIIGEGPERDRLSGLIKELDLSEHVCLAGFRKDVKDILERSNIGILCSDSEGLSNTIIEYMAAGLPVVCTAVGGNVELIEHNKQGFLFKPGDHQDLAACLLLLLQDPELARTMGQAAARRARDTFGVRRYITATEQFFLDHS
jgi:glycosyltransferase involved in cell wall biosynthesis